MVTDPTWIWRDCEHCGTPFGQPDDPGRKRRYCSGACRTGAYRARKRRQEQADRGQDERARRARDRERRNQEQRQRQDRQANEDAWWNARERYQRQQHQQHQPPPHAGTSRPGTWCGPCGGLRSPHTYHPDDQAHTRARRRYDGLRAKAAGTSFPHEADACRAKADAMRDKYGL
jgi:hypothetical protein